MKLTNLFDPIKIPSGEKELLRTRESLRIRGILWVALGLWTLGLLTAWITTGLTMFVAGRWSETLLNVALILLVAGALPLLFLLIVSSWDGTYEISDAAIARGRDRLLNLKRTYLGRFGRTTSPADRMDEMRVEIPDVQQVIAPVPQGLGYWLNVGDVTVFLKGQAEALVLRNVDKPQDVADEIGRRVWRATSRSSASTAPDATKQAQEAPLVVSTSVPWILLRWSPVGIAIWVAVAAWVTLRLATALPSPTMLSLLKAATLVSIVAIPPVLIVSFLKWWYRVYVLTERRVIHRSGVFNIERRDLLLDDVVSASATKSGLGNFINVGSVDVFTAGLSGDIHMRYITAPDQVRQLILATQERLRRQQDQLELQDIQRRLQAILGSQAPRE